MQGGPELEALARTGEAARAALAARAARPDPAPGPPSDARLAELLERGRALAALGHERAGEVLRAAVDAASALALPAARRAAFLALGAWLVARADRVVGRAHLERVLEEASRAGDGAAGDAVAAACALAAARAQEGDHTGAQAALHLAQEAAARLSVPAASRAAGPAAAAAPRLELAAAVVARGRGDLAAAATALLALARRLTPRAAEGTPAAVVPLERELLLAEAGPLAAELAAGRPTRADLARLPAGELAAVVEVGLAAAAGPPAARGPSLCAAAQALLRAARVALVVDGRVLAESGGEPPDGPPPERVALGAAAFAVWPGPGAPAVDPRQALLLRVLLGGAPTGATDDAAARTLLLLQRLLDAGLDLERLAVVATDLAVEATGAARGFLLLREAGARLGFRAARRGGVDVADPGGVVSATLVREALRAGRALLLADAAADPAHGEAESVGARGLRSVLVAPIVEGGEVLGALYLDDPGTVGRFGPLEREVAVGFAARLGGPLRAALERDDERGRAASLAAALARPTARPATRRPFPRIVGRGPAMADLLRLLDRAAATRASVLITGESGTGKEVVARSLHEASDRAGPLQAVSCAALSDGVLESELFGHAEGAFTGAVGARRGLFELASGGTLFLDELQEASPRLQAELLRVLETGEVRPVGAGEARPVDVRVVAATNVDLGARVASGAFREDLYHRLAVVHVALPPLRARLEDLPDLAAHFLAKAGRTDPLDPGALARLLAHPWPGNVRALRNCLERALVLAGDGPITAEHIVVEAVPRAAPAPPPDRERGLRSGDRPPLLHAAVELSSRQLELLEAIRAEGELGNAEWAERAGVSQPTGWRDLKDLVAKGLLVAAGRARNTTYRLAPGWEARLRGE